MKHSYTINEIKRLLQDGAFSQEEVAQWKNDSRKGVQKLVQQYEKEQQYNIQCQKQFQEMLYFERLYQRQGKKYIAGIDEAGRGPLAGPVVAAAVMLPDNFYLAGLTDSKQLTEKKRLSFFEYIKENALCYGISVVSNETIDKVNIYEATKLAMQEAVTQLTIEPDHLLVDAVQLPNMKMSIEAIIKGDQRSVSIAAASVLAKVTRDHYMKQLAVSYPAYEFERNMGYGTKSHLEALRRVGVTPYHRRSFSPVRHAL
ncbi:ribonuclease HII [Pontibacillus litoralis]|uniref:Ribonuclease HII n=1 Tax=Pontibacillus litoralis JSM 072002 TaxID=1385512 RepID=A0A0A5GBG9_9BACI|nr:ribonuclease HII [Pontibacillus litoralis]KGX88465.1 ribonuclease HII [Pontibacillus litoralis JSM 072002]